MKKTILLADDSVTIQKVVELTFIDEQYEVIAVGSGDEALAKLEEGTPDLVIADVHMPGASGTEVSREVGARFPGLPVLLLVGAFEPFEESEVEECGASAHLKKPFDSQDLLRVADELMGDEPDSVVEEEAAVGLAGDAIEAKAIGEEVAKADLPSAEEVSHDAEEQEATAAGVSEPSVAISASDAAESAHEESAASEETETEAIGGESEEPAESGTDDLSEGVSSGVDTEASGVTVSAGSDAVPLNDETIDAIARRVAEMIGKDSVREIAWEIVPDMAEVLIKDRLRELEDQVD